MDEVVAYTATVCARDAAALPDGAGSSAVTLYAGAAGVGLELLHHDGPPEVGKALDGLARRTATHPASRTVSEALYTGRTGVELFLARVSARGYGPVRPYVPDTGGGTADDGSGDQIGGAAGRGTGYLLLAREAGADGDETRAAAFLAAAGTCAAELLAADGAQIPQDPGPAPVTGSLAAYRYGFAHGGAGVVHFLSAYHRITGDQAAGAAARTALTALAARTPALLEAAAHPAATRRYGSWCRGLAGIGGVLLDAAVHDDDPALLDLAVRCARACHALAPRMSPVSRCCGLSGAGELLIDAAHATGDKGLWRAADDVAALVLARSGGTPARPVFPGNTLTAPAPSWATGTAGVLTFLRRLRDRGGPRLLAV
nr:lanthionine synthetase LanC family protein [Streptomyces sp. SID5468]